MDPQVGAGHRTGHGSKGVSIAPVEDSIAHGTGLNAAYVQAPSDPPDPDSGMEPEEAEVVFERTDPNLDLSWSGAPPSEHESQGLVCDAGTCLAERLPDLVVLWVIGLVVGAVFSLVPIVGSLVAMAFVSVLGSMVFLKLHGGGGAPMSPAA